MKNEILKLKIKLEVVLKYGLCKESSITLDDFMTLYKSYDYLPEYYFASILDINFTQYHSLKYEGQETVPILRYFDYTIIKNEEQIVKELFEEKLVTYDMSLSYSKFLFLNKRYPYLNEIEFAEIFQIKPSTLRAMKYKKEIILFLKKNLS